MGQIRGGTSADVWAKCGSSVVAACLVRRALWADASAENTSQWGTTSMTTALYQLPKTEVTHAQLCNLLTRERYFTLARLEGLFERRDAVDAERLTASPEEQPWLVRALDAAIVSYYRLAGALGI
jgi:hypothetical protein